MGRTEQLNFQHLDGNDFRLRSRRCPFRNRQHIQLVHFARRELYIPIVPRTRYMEGPRTFPLLPVSSPQRDAPAHETYLGTLQFDAIQLRLLVRTEYTFLVESAEPDHHPLDLTKFHLSFKM
jgi:hypothetical protein